MNEKFRTIYSELMVLKIKVFKEGIFMAQVFSPYSNFGEENFLKIDLLYKKYATKHYERK